MAAAIIPTTLADLPPPYNPATDPPELAYTKSAAPYHIVYYTNGYIFPHDFRLIKVNLPTRKQWMVMGNSTANDFKYLLIQENEFSLIEGSQLPEGLKNPALAPLNIYPQEIVPLFNIIQNKVSYSLPSDHNIVPLLCSALVHFGNIDDQNLLLKQMLLWTNKIMYPTWDPTPSLVADGFSLIIAPAAVIGQVFNFPIIQDSNFWRKNQAINFFLMSILCMGKGFSRGSHFQEYQKSRLGAFLATIGYQALSDYILPDSISGISSIWNFMPLTKISLARSILFGHPQGDIQKQVKVHARLILGLSGMASFNFARQAVSVLCSSPLIADRTFVDELRTPFKAAVDAFDTAGEEGPYMVLLNHAQVELFTHNKWPILAYAGAALNRSYNTTSMQNFKVDDQKISASLKGRVDAAIKAVRDNPPEVEISDELLAFVRLVEPTAQRWKKPESESDKLAKLLAALTHRSGV